MNGCVWAEGFDPSANTLQVNRWIVTELAERSEQVVRAVQEYKFNDAAGALYHFTWGTFCDWYLEFIKPVLAEGDRAAQAETRATCAWVLGQVLHMLHPFMPFITEELWANLTAGQGGRLISAAWPEIPGTARDAAARDGMDWVVRLISGIRAVRAEMNVPAAAKIPLLVKGASARTKERLSKHRTAIERLARIEAVSELSGPAPKGAVSSVLDEATLILPLTGIVDLGAEKIRLAREIAKTDSEIGKIEKKLGNSGFLAKAPEEVVAENRERMDEYATQKQKLSEALARLADV
jgi:valyl-tRNA synthetase